MSFSVAIIGRPNVGKSTLFNRLAGRRLALVDPTPGLTRDRRDAEIDLDGTLVRLIDTAGLEEADADSITARMRSQTERAIREADLVLFVIDARDGVTPADELFAELVRAAGRPVRLVTNKCEGRSGTDGYYESYQLGFGEPTAISAEHGEGIGELIDLIIAAIPTEQRVAAPNKQRLGRKAQREAAAAAAEAEAEAVAEAERAAKIALVAAAKRQAEALARGEAGDENIDAEPDAEPDTAEPDRDGEGDDGDDDILRPIRLAIVGRPNAGKSTLVNAIIGDERMITGPEAGITRDSIETAVSWQGRDILLFDTAGLRRKARIHERAEKLSASDAINAVRYAEVVVLLLDSERPFDKQDLQIAELVASEGRALVIAVNKWDLVADKQAMILKLREEADRLLPQIKGVAVVSVSALSGRGIDKLMKAVFATHEIWNRRIGTSKLNSWLGEMVATHMPPAASGRRIRLRYMTQSNTRPPTFIVFCSRPQALPDSYTRYLVNGLRASFDLPGVPIRLFLRKGDNPYK